MVGNYFILGSITQQAFKKYDCIAKEGAYPC